jgi:hypothetical protein
LRVFLCYFFTRKPQYCISVAGGSRIVAQPGSHILPLNPEMPNCSLITWKPHCCSARKLHALLLSPEAALLFTSEAALLLNPEAALLLSPEASVILGSPGSLIIAQSGSLVLVSQPGSRIAAQNIESIILFCF